MTASTYATSYVENRRRRVSHEAAEPGLSLAGVGLDEEADEPAERLLFLLLAHGRLDEDHVGVDLGVGGLGRWSDGGVLVSHVRNAMPRTAAPVSAS